MELNVNGNYVFTLKGRQYELKFEGEKTNVLYQGVPQKALTILREYIVENKLPIIYEVLDKKGFMRSYTTQEIGREFKKFLGLTKSKNRKEKVSNQKEKTGPTKSKKEEIGKIVFSNNMVLRDRFVGHEKQYQTDINWLIDTASHLVERKEIKVIKSELFYPINSYNSFIMEEIVGKPGVYIWFNKKTNEVLYIGMAGKIKTNGKLTDHPLNKRLTAARVVDVATKQHISTNLYVSSVLELFEINELNFHILIAKEEEPASYIESVLLYQYFKKHKVLPILNNAF